MFVVAILVSACAAAATARGSAEAASPAAAVTERLPLAASLQATAPALAPSGFVSFCVRFPDQCATPQNAADAVVLTQAIWQKLRQVNAEINAEIWPESDQRHYNRAEYWTIPTDGYGDCEDYALTKRKTLIGTGIPALALRIAIVKTASDARHAVLTVVTDRGDFVLDNLKTDIVGAEATHYTWLERQDSREPTAWVSLETPPTTPAARTVSIADATAAIPSTPLP